MNLAQQLRSRSNIHDVIARSLPRPASNGMEFSIRNNTKGMPPSVPFRVIAESVLGKNAEISVAFVSKKTSKKLNRTLRGKKYPSNILTFPFGKNHGEIIICPSVAKESASAFHLSYQNMLILLFIHGLLHLKGVPHGATMERLEARLLKRYKQ